LYRYAQVAMSALQDTMLLAEADYLVLHHMAGLYTLHSVDPADLESAWLQPLEPEMCVSV
jgi:hypothetical protein